MWASVRATNRRGNVPVHRHRRLYQDVGEEPRSDVRRPRPPQRDPRAAKEGSDLDQAVAYALASPLAPTDSCCRVRTVWSLVENWVAVNEGPQGSWIFDPTLNLPRVVAAKSGKAVRVGFEPTRRLDTAYAISNLKRAPYRFRSQRPNLSHYVRLVWPLAAFVEVLTYPGVHCVRSRTGPVAVKPFERTRTADLHIASARSVVTERCTGFAYPAFLSGFLFPRLPTIAGYCVRVRIKLGARVRGLRVAGSCSSLTHAHQYAPPQVASAAETLTAEQSLSHLAIGGLYKKLNVDLLGGQLRLENDLFQNCFQVAHNLCPSFLA